jgi:hypothetical protein
MAVASRAAFTTTIRTQSGAFAKRTFPGGIVGWFGTLLGSASGCTDFDFIIWHKFNSFKPIESILIK